MYSVAIEHAKYVHKKYECDHSKSMCGSYVQNVQRLQGGALCKKTCTSQCTRKAHELLVKYTIHVPRVAQPRLECRNFSSHRASCASSHPHKEAATPRKTRPVSTAQRWSSPYCWPAHGRSWYWRCCYLCVSSPENLLTFRSSLSLCLCAWFLASWWVLTSDDRHRGCFARCRTGRWT